MKTQFKKGHKSVNCKPLGSIRKCRKDGYWLIKTAQPNKFEALHRVIYRKKVGEIERGNVIVFLDGNKDNLEVGNLRQVKRGTMAVVNKCFGRAPKEHKNAAILIVEIQRKAKELINVL